MRHLIIGTIKGEDFHVFMDSPTNALAVLEVLNMVIDRQQKGDYVEGRDITMRNIGNDLYVLEKDREEAA